MSLIFCCKRNLHKHIEKGGTSVYNNDEKNRKTGRKNEIIRILLRFTRRIDSATPY